MSRLLWIALFLLCGAAPAWAAPLEDKKEDKKEDAAAANPATLDADDNASFVAHVNKQLQRLVPLIDSDPDSAEKGFNELLKTLEGASAKTDGGKQLLEQGKGVVNNMKQRLEIARISLEDLEKALEKDADDAGALSKYGLKVQMAAGSIARSEPDKAAEIVASARKLLEGLKDRAEKSATKSTADGQLRRLTSLDRAIEDARRLAKLVGTDAQPIEVESWVNGEPLTTADLKGKVVLLDFWAVWCGPCIATFPHLKEWNEKFSEKGLVIIGLTKYYSYDWDETMNRATRVPNVSQEQERKMLVKFAEHHGLHHRFAIQNDDKLSQHYAVSGIPHVVLIDRSGKVRMIRVGSGDQNARDLGGLIEKLIEEGAAADKAGGE